MLAHEKFFIVIKKNFLPSILRILCLLIYVDHHYDDGGVGSEYI